MPYGLNNKQIAELVRVALDKHSASVSSILGIAIRMLKKQSPGLRLLVSFADPDRGHCGSIYQAGNWTYTGVSVAGDEYLVNGRTFHGRALRGTRAGRMPYLNTLDWAKKTLSANAQKIKGSSKYRYLYPLDKAMRAQIAPLAKPYPKRGTGETDNAPDTNQETGGASPTVPLLQSAFGVTGVLVD